MISILKDSMSLTNLGIPLLPKEMQILGGAQLPNGDLLITGGGPFEGPFPRGPFSSCNDISYEYFHYKDGSNQWKKVGTMKGVRVAYSSVSVDDSLLTTGGCDWQSNSSGSISTILSNHEEFSINGGVKERTNMPIALKYHAAAVFGKHTILISGGLGDEVNEIFH